MAPKAKISKKDHKRDKALTALVIISAILVFIFYVSTKLIAMNTPTAPDQSNAAGDGFKGGKKIPSPTVTKISNSGVGQKEPDLSPYKSPPGSKAKTMNPNK